MNMIGSVSSQPLTAIQPTSAIAKPANHQRDHTHDGDNAHDHDPEHDRERDAAAFAVSMAKASESSDPQHALNTTA
jgi:hypothetical protein